MSGKLYVVGTPIGNLEDITYRAVRILSEADFICAEDTRVTLKLLNHYGIKKPLIIYNEHSGGDVTDKIIGRIRAGENCAAVTDAGMPCISDPGADLVTKCRDGDIPVEVVPGPTAVASAAAVCGIPAARFAFEGFLEVKKSQRLEHLRSVSRLSHAVIFYEAPHKLTGTLADMLEVLGDRRIALCREMTKLHEEVIRTTLSGAIEYYKEKEPKGEYVIVIEGFKEKYTLEDALSIARSLTEKGVKLSDACKEAAGITGIKKADIYSKLL